jgi:hypothetical protein
VGATVLLTQPAAAAAATAPPTDSFVADQSSSAARPVLWIEGESDNGKCPVRDGASLTSPVAEGSLLGDLWAAANVQTANDSEDTSLTTRLSTVAGKVTERIKQVKAADLASLVGIDQRFTDRELRLVQSIWQGKALTHHLEDEYYAGMGLASGFSARVGQDVVELTASTEAQRDGDDSRAALSGNA